MERASSSPDPANNRSYLSVDLYLEVTAANGAGGPFRTSPADSNGYVTSSQLGTLINVTQGYDLRPAASLPSIYWGHWEGWVTHDADGTKTVNFSYGFTGGGGTPLGSGSGSDSIVLPALPRGPYVGVAGVAKSTLVYVGVGGVAKQAQMYIGVGGVAKLVG